MRTSFTGKGDRDQRKIEPKKLFVLPIELQALDKQPRAPYQPLDNPGVNPDLSLTQLHQLSVVRRTEISSHEGSLSHVMQ